MQSSMIKLIKPADFISMLNAGFGFIALLLLSFQDVNQEFFIYLSFSFILLALLADGLDGIIARRTQKGKLGEYFEAMADMISMGIAPAFFIFINYQSEIQTFSMVWIVGFIIILLCYVFCCSIRLAAFHPLKSETYFMGLPASAATILLISCTFIGIELIYIILLLLITSLTMVSSVPYPKPSKKMNVLTTVLILASILIGYHFNNIMIYLLLICILFYFVGGPLYLMKKSKD
jgi:phosphatidylserine synthase